MNDLAVARRSSMTWMDDAVCVEVDPEMFFQGHERDVVTIAQVKRVCQACPVQAECLQYAIDEDIWHGIWGGLTERERHAVRRRRHLAAVG